MDEQIHGACVDRKCHLKSSKFTVKVHEEDTDILLLLSHHSDDENNQSHQSKPSATER